MTRARGARRRAGLPGGIFGMGAMATTALAVLVFGCVFATTAGPREALATTTQALRQALAGTSPLSRTITATATSSAVTADLSNGFAFGGSGNASLTAGQLGDITGQLHADFNRGAIKLLPASADWMAMTSRQHQVTTSLPVTRTTDSVVELEVTYRQPFAQYMRLVAGRYPGTVSSTSAPGSTTAGRATFNYGNSASFAPLLQVVVSSQTAREFSLHPGSKVGITGPEVFSPGGLSGITLEVTGIVAPRDPSSSFWTSYPELSAPDLECTTCAQEVWIGGAFVGPGELSALQQDFGVESMAMQWDFPLAPVLPSGQQAQPLYDALNRLGSQSPALTGNVSRASSALTASCALLQPLGTFLSTANAVDTVLWLLYVSLAVAGLITLLLAARMVAMRRSAELAVRRARGASLAQIAAVTAAGAALACGPAAAVGAVLAVLVVSGSTPSGAWWAPAGVVLVAICAPAAVAAWQQRLPRRAAGRAVSRGRIRLVAEATACLAAIAGIIVFRQQGGAGAGVNLYTSAAPALVAVPAVIVVLRVYPAVLRGLLRGSARRPGAAAFVGLARASRTSLTPALPAFALVLALTVATFAGMVRDAVTRGDVAASWQAAGADVTIMASGAQAVTASASAVLSPAALRALAAVPGVTRSAEVLQAGWSTPGGQQITGLAVDPAEYAALVADTQTFPAVPSRLLAAAPAGAPQPVLASPQAAIVLGTGVTALTSQADVHPVQVRVAGVLSGTPALAAGGAFVLMPLSAIRSAATPPSVPVNELLLTGTSIDSARLATVMNTMAYAGVATVRSVILAGLTGAPLQHGAFVLFELSIAVAAALGLAVMLLELALGAAERETTLARLATMGLGEGQRARVVALEVLPALGGAAVAAVACALVLPWVARPAIDLSVFTGSLAGVPLTPDVASFALPLGGLAVVALAALYAQIRSGRRRSVAAILRVEG